MAAGKKLDWSIRNNRRTHIISGNATAVGTVAYKEVLITKGFVVFPAESRILGAGYNINTNVIYRYCFQRIGHYETSL